jgi:hypothetical protein
MVALLVEMTVELMVATKAANWEARMAETMAVLLVEMRADATAEKKAVKMVELLVETKAAWMVDLEINDKCEEGRRRYTREGGK